MYYIIIIIIKGLINMLMLYFLLLYIVNLWYSKPSQFHMNNSDHLVGQIYAVPFGSQVKRSEVSDTLCHSAARAKTDSKFKYVSSDGTPLVRAFSERHS